MEVENVVVLLQRTLPKMIRIETRLAADLGSIMADPVQMEQILMNLAGNARDAMPEGGTLVIETRNVFLSEEDRQDLLDLAPGPHVLLEVSDTGRGMNDEVRQRIFEPFFTTKDVGKGTGLGLPMVYGIVQDHHGHIACASHVGRGTTFSILFPAAVGDYWIAEPQTDEPGRDQFVGGETILMVDDEEMIRDVTQELLTGYGYSLLLAKSGEEALDIYGREQERIDLVITDLGMPGMGGEALVAELIRVDPQARIIVATGYAASMDRPGLQQAAAFISKPYTADGLVRMIRQVLDRVSMPGEF
jgi:two-component system, cell cycle sensor histidine kinase and response regulator CckA